MYKTGFSIENDNESTTKIKQDLQTERYPNPRSELLKS